MSEHYHALGTAQGIFWACLLSSPCVNGSTLMPNKERDFVVAMYPGRDWARRVARMSQEQVVAIYLRAQSAPPKPKAEPQTKESEDGPSQSPLF